MMISPSGFLLILFFVFGFWGFFSHFFKILIFWVEGLIKGQKMVQNNKKFCHVPYPGYEPPPLILEF